MKLPSKFLIFLAGLALAATPAHATIDAFSTANGTTGPNTPPVLNSSYGTVDVALNLGNSSGGTLVYDGITFTNNNVTSGTNTVSWATVGGITVGGVGGGTGAVWQNATNIVSGSPGPSSIYNSMFGTESWSNGTSGTISQTINITGLDAGKSYLIQLLHGEDRSIGNGITYNGTLSATDSLANNSTAGFIFGDGGVLGATTDDPTYIFGVVSLEVSGVTGVSVFYPNRTATGSDRDPSLAGIVIQSNTSSTPLISSLSPTDNSTGVSLTTNLAATFNQAVIKGTGDITIKSTGGTHETIAVTSGQVTISPANTVTINPSIDLVTDTDYWVEIAPGAVESTSNQDFPGITDSTTWNFDTRVPPAVASLIPADNAVGVALNTNLEIAFNENVKKGTGNIVIESAGGIHETVNVASGQVSVSGATVTVNPSTDLNIGTTYWVTIGAGAIEDTAGTDFPGIVGSTAWNFETVTPPLVTGVTPADNAYSVPLASNLVIIFNETVQKGTGNIYVRTGGSAVQTIAVTTAAVTLSTTNVSNDTVTVDISDLSVATDYAIQIDAGGFEDTLGADFAGIGNDTTWNFTTSSQPPSPVDSFTAVNGATGPNTPPTLDNTFGTLELALNLGNSSGGTIALDGITFTNNNVTSGTNIVNWATVNGISVGATTNVGAAWAIASNIVPGSPGPSSLYNNTYGTEAWSNKIGGGVFQTINVTGLDPGKSYQIQLMHGEDRSIGNGLTYSGTLAATSGNSLPANVAFTFGDDGDADETVFGLVTLVVSGTTSIDITYPATSGDRDPSLAGIVIHSTTGGPVNPYDTWAAVNAPTGNPDDDFDGDGVPNAVEFVLGGDKNTNDLNKLPVVVATSGGDMTFTFVRDQDSVDPGVSVVIEVGTNLATWPDTYSVPGTATAGPPVAVVDNLNGTDTVVLTVTRAPDTKKFARLKVVITP